ncbi:MAG TPA: hypothetical protein VF519_10650 [Mycobacteriales bacterium]|jgi:hypothetical protein
MNRARLLAAAVALLAGLLLARALFAPPPPVPLALPVPAASLSPASPAAPPPAPPAATWTNAASSPPAASPAAPAPASATAPSPPTPAELRAALAALDATRAAAFARPAGADPGAWADPRCACHADDARRLRDLARDGLALRGHRVTLVSLAVTRATATRADLLLVDRAAGYAAVDRSGRAVARWPESGPRRWRVTLVRAGGRWLFGQVARAP